MARGARGGRAAHRSDANDSIIEGSHVADVLTGTGGADFIHGKSGNDTIYALGGNDIISAGQGDDLIWGGPGNDTFQITQSAYGHDTIFDWNVGDVIDIQRGRGHTVEQIGDDVRVTLAGGAVIDILGVNIADVTVI